jgi:hypothetical protein
VLGGVTCDALEVTFDDAEFAPWVALGGDGRYLVGGAFGGIISSSDGASWEPVLEAR